VVPKKRPAFAAAEVVRDVAEAADPEKHAAEREREEERDFEPPATMLSPILVDLRAEGRERRPGDIVRNTAPGVPPANLLDRREKHVQPEQLACSPQMLGQWMPLEGREVSEAARQIGMAALDQPPERGILPQDGDRRGNLRRFGGGDSQPA